MKKYVWNSAAELEHRAIAEKILGRPLKGREVVHHVDHNGLNNELSNLVICPNDGYHRLLHIRERALDACGNPTFRQCVRCGKYDDPAVMQPHAQNEFEHPACNRERLKMRRQFKGDAVRAHDRAYRAANKLKINARKARYYTERKQAQAKAGAFMDSFYRSESWL